jgi:hypothetical protein
MPNHHAFAAGPGRDDLASQVSDPETAATGPGSGVATDPEPADPDRAEPVMAGPDLDVPAPVIDPDPVVTDPGRSTPTAPALPTTGPDDPLIAVTGDQRAGWQRVKAGFVDDPRASVTEAAVLVEEAAGKLATALRDRQRHIRDTWDGDGQAGDTEDLRLALIGYQSLFERISGQ